MGPLIWIIDEEWTDYETEKALLTARFPTAEIRRSGYDYGRDLEAFGVRADLILAQIYAAVPAAVIGRLERCRGIAVYGGGYDRVDIQAARERGIKVTNVQGYCAEDLADYVLAAIFRHSKEIDAYQGGLTDRLWGAPAVKHVRHRVSGSTLLLIGCGTIGRTVAAKAGALGMTVLGYDPHVPEEEMARAGIEKTSLEAGLERADYISLHVKLTGKTRGLIGKEEFERMKPTAYFINTARGGLVVEEELIQACQSGKLSGACVDVIAEEPPTGREAIFSCDRILVTPHVSYISRESFDTLKERTVRNAICMYEGGEPEDWVNR